MSLQDLKPLAEQNLPNIVFQGSTPEERLLTGFVVAKQHMTAIIPAGHSVDAGVAATVQERYEKQILERKNLVAASLSAKQDLPEPDALIEDAKTGKEYWMSTYALAAEGIAAYATGYARQQVTYGLLSEKDYYDSIDLRTKSFASIVNAGQNGTLAQLVAPEAWYQSKMQSSEAARTMQASGQLQRGGLITLSTAGTKIQALDTTRKLVPVQLGFDLVVTPTVALIIAGTLVLSITMVSLIGFLTWGSVEKNRIRASAEFMGQMCKNAGNDPAITQACTEYASKISTPTPMPGGLDNLSKYLVWGAVGLGALWMLPSLMERFGRSK
jgi:hypothetical protein